MTTMMMKMKRNKMAAMIMMIIIMMMMKIAVMMMMMMMMMMVVTIKMTLTKAKFLKPQSSSPVIKFLLPQINKLHGGINSEGLQSTHNHSCLHN